MKISFNDGIIENGIDLAILMVRSRHIIENKRKLLVW